MKTIQPVNIWVNGQNIQAVVLNAYCSSDNLQNSATFQYQLMSEESSPYDIPYLKAIAQGFLTMDGEVYQNWQTNDYAYDWVASQLNLVITGDYIPPTPLEPTPKQDVVDESTQLI